jgi:hypothetical protein
VYLCGLLSRLFFSSVFAVGQGDKEEVMLVYHVQVKEDDIVHTFECEADDWFHAVEQAENAYPKGKVLRADII